jgi:hypothetical protein
MIDEMWNQREAEPFRFAVDGKAVPLYRKVIRKPIDLSQIRANIDEKR